MAYIGCYPGTRENTILNIFPFCSFVTDQIFEQINMDSSCFSVGYMNTADMSNASVFVKE